MLTIDKKSVKAGKLVDTNHVDTIVKNYKQERWVHNSKRIGKEDSLSVWYTVDELQEFMELAKAHGADGIRLYFGAYSKDQAPKELYKGRQTVVLVATKQRDTENGGTTNKDVYITTDKGSSILAYNVGNMCPPFCGELEPDEIGITIVDKGKDGLAIR